MKHIGPSAWLGLTAALFATGVGCVVQQEPTGPAYVSCPSEPYCGSGGGGGGGDIALSWSIDHDTTGAMCEAHDAAQIEVKITDSAGQTVDDWRLPCTGGATDEVLPAGVYTASGQLEDVNGSPITTADPSQFVVYAGASAQPIDFDFEENSFTNGT